MTQPILTSPQELETWLDEFIAEQMDELHIPGVTFSLVQNGELFFAKGYGYADLEQQIPVVANRTLFRVGQISTLFTATAIMQLVEKGLLNLDDDVNKYLPDFPIENNYPQPITIDNLLTHTAGFDERFIGIQTLEASTVIPLGEYLAKKMPKPIIPPGELLKYSDRGYALLGYIVELVVDIPFSQYMDENILQPLEMNNSSFELPSRLSANLALSYIYQEKRETYQALPFNYQHMPPAWSLNTTATDMANFATAHLQSGKFKSQRILAETTAKQMQQQQFTNDPHLRGQCYGFSEFTHNKHSQREIGRTIGHAGRISGFRNHLLLSPKHNLGLFVADNGSAHVSNKIIDRFCNRYFPVVQNSPLSQPSPENKQFPKRYEGSYFSGYFPQHSLAKSLLLFNSPLRLKAEADGTLTIPKTAKISNSLHFHEVEPLILRQTGHRDNCMVAKEGDDGRISHLFNSVNGIWDKLAWYETNTFHWMLIWFFILVFLSGCVVSILTWTRFPVDSGHQLAQLLAGITCGLNLIFTAGMLILELLSKNNRRLRLVYGVPKIVTLLLCIPLLTSILAVGLPVVAIMAWMNQEWSLIEQLHYFLISLIALGWIPFLNYWNLLGFRY